MLARLGRHISRHAGIVAAVWLVAAALGYGAAVGGIGPVDSLFSRLTTSGPAAPGEASDGQDLITANATTGPSVQLLLSQVDPASAVLRRELAATRADLTAVPGVARILDPTVPKIGAGFVSTAGDAVLVDVALAKGLDPAAEKTATDAVVERLDQVPAAVPGSTGRVGGVSFLVEEITGQVEKDLRKGEGLALPLSLLVMVVIFGGLAAAGVPLVAAFASIAGGLATLLGFSYLTDLDATVVNVVTVLGLGLCIDYALLVVSRYREEIHAGGRRHDVPSRAEREEAIAATMATAGRTVMFSGITVAIAVSGLLFFRVDVIRAVGLGAVSIVVIALLVALTLVPALLTLGTKWIAGPGVFARIPGLRSLTSHFGDAPPVEGAFSRLAARVQRRPWLVAGGVSLLLVALAVPSWRMQTVQSGVELLPPDNPQRAFFVDVQEQFPAAALTPIQVVVDAPVTAAATRNHAAEIGRLPDVERVDAPRPLGPSMSVIDVMPVGLSEGDQAKNVVHVLRDSEPGVTTWVTGQTAFLVDFEAEVRARAPWALAVVVTATFVLLFLLTGSVLVPVKALAMNVLSLGATFGLLVLVFQDGRLEGLLNYASTGGIETFIPVMVFAFAFGLAMDYEVFLLARIKEMRDSGLDNDAAVRAGLQRTGRIITSAALIIVIVFAGFVVGDLLAIKQTGFALATAVLIDATLVRMLLVPATMTLLGEWNWWAPAPLRRLHDRFGLREGADPSGESEPGGATLGRDTGSAPAGANVDVDDTPGPAGGDRTTQPA